MRLLHIPKVALTLCLIGFSTFAAHSQKGAENPPALDDAELTKLHAQRDTNKSEATKPRQKQDIEISTRNIKFGVGFGAGYAKSTMYSYTLAAPNYALARDKTSNLFGGVSGVIAYNKTVYYRQVVEGKAVGEPYAMPYPVSALLAINLVDFTAEGVGFNTPIDLGLGMGVRLGEGFQIGAFVELSRQPYLRDAYTSYLGQPIPDFKQNQTLTVLDITDDNYFKSQTVVAFSIRFIYLFSDDKPKTKDLTARLPEGQNVTAP